MNIFKIEPGLFVWTWVSFGLLFFVMAKFVFPSLMKGLKERERKIADSIDNAQAIEKRLADIDEKYKKVLSEANRKADEIIRRTRNDAEQLKARYLADAEKEAQAVLAEAREKIKEERSQIINTLRTEIADFVCDTSEELIGSSFTGEQEKQWARELVQKL